MATLIVELPTEVDAQEARLLLAIKLYETGKLLLGQAARRDRQVGVISAFALVFRQPPS